MNKQRFLIYGIQLVQKDNNDGFPTQFCGKLIRGKTKRKIINEGQ